MTIIVAFPRLLKDGNLRAPHVCKASRQCTWNDAAPKYKTYAYAVADLIQQ